MVSKRKRFFGYISLVYTAFQFKCSHSSHLLSRKVLLIEGDGQDNRVGAALALVFTSSYENYRGVLVSRRRSLFLFSGYWSRSEFGELHSLDCLSSRSRDELLLLLDFPCSSSLLIFFATVVRHSSSKFERLCALCLLLNPNLIIVLPKSTCFLHYILKL